MNEKLIKILIGVMMKVMSPEQIKDFAGHVCGFVRQKITGTLSKADDIIVFPILDVVEEAFGITEG